MAWYLENFITTNICNLAENKTHQKNDSKHVFEIMSSLYILNKCNLEASFYYFISLCEAI